MPIGFFRPDGTKLKLPPVIFGQLGNDPKKKTLLIYGHLDGKNLSFGLYLKFSFTFSSGLSYLLFILLSVQPAAKEDGWDTEPFVLTKSSDGSKLYGRGATDDKGPVTILL